MITICCCCCDCGTMITWIGVLATFFTVSFVGFNIWQYFNVSNRIKNLKKESERIENDYKEKFDFLKTYSKNYTLAWSEFMKLQVCINEKNPDTTELKKHCENAIRLLEEIKEFKLSADIKNILDKTN